MDELDVLFPEGSVQPPLPEELLRRFARQTQLDFEVDFFAGILDRDANYVEVLRVMGNNLTAKGELQRGLEIDRRLAQLCPEDCVAHYNLACSYSLLAMVEPALRSLQRAIDSGYTEFDYMQEDRDLETVRKDPRFRKLLESYGITQADSAC